MLRIIPLLFSYLIFFSLSAKSQDIENFDSFPVGEFTSLNTVYGILQADTGTAAIEAVHARSAPNTLRIKGGTDKTVELLLQDSITPRYFSVYSERYASAGTLQYRFYSVNSEGEETEIFNADSTPTSTKCATKISFYIPLEARSLRFRVSSTSGVLLDDMQVATLPDYETFDLLPEGEITNAQLLYGILTAETGHVATSTTRYLSAPYSLRLLGGNEKTCLLTLKKPLESIKMLSFVAERWTNSTPFTFRVYACIGNQEQEIKNADTVATGGLKTSVSAPLPLGTTAIRLKSTTPVNTGVLIDNLFLGDLPDPEIFTGQYPIMIRTEKNPCLHIQLWGDTPDSTLNAITVDLSQTDNIDDIAAVELYEGDISATGNMTKLTSSTAIGPQTTLTLEPEKGLVGVAQKNYWISIILKETASLDRKICIQVTNLSLSGKITTLTNSPISRQRIGYAIAKKGDTGGEKPSNYFRIPALARSKQGTLVAAYDIRYNHSGDLPAHIDVGIKRSLDNGQTWSKMTVAMNYNNDNSTANGIGDPSILVDDITGRIWIAALGKKGIANSTGGLTDETTGQFCLVYSDDDGLTWSPIRSITPDIKEENWKIFFQGPGHGITTKEGTLIFPAQYWDEGGRSHSTFIYSKNRGDTWKRANAGLEKRTSEAIITELADGTLMINARNEDRNGARVIATTTDYGNTWTYHSTNVDKVNGLIEPTCQASILAVENTGKNNQLQRALIFSNPESGSRQKMTLKISFDEGTTWANNNKVLYDTRTLPGYSDLASAGDEHIGVIYEGVDAAHIFYLRIPYSELLPSFSLGATTCSISAANNTKKTVPLDCTGTWTASSDASWITLNTTASGEPLSYTTTANNSPLDRTGTITIKLLGMKDLTYTIIQAGETVSYEQWAETHFPPTATEGTGALESYAHDNISNIIKYACGLTPTTPSGTIGTMTITSEKDKSYFTWTFPLNPKTTGISYTIEYYTNPTDWKNATKVPLNIPQGHTSYTYKHPIPVTSETSQQFFRLAIEKK